MSEYAKLGTRCESSMRIIPNNHKFIPIKSELYNSVSVYMNTHTSNMIHTNNIDYHHYPEWSNVEDIKMPHKKCCGQR